MYLDYLPIWSTLDVLFSGICKMLLMLKLQTVKKNTCTFYYKNYAYSLFIPL